MKPTAEQITRSLRKTAALRELCARMPRVLSPAQERALAEFLDFERGARASCSRRALRLGLETLWRMKAYERIVRVSSRVDEPDLDAATYFSVAQMAVEQQP